MRTLACWKAGVSGLARDQFQVGKPIKQFRWYRSALRGRAIWLLVNTAELIHIESGHSWPSGQLSVISIL